jgi:tetratricopeptide (TPR) repeat protein
MKAEHRKELQTNLLADRLGRIMQSLRDGTWKIHPSTKGWLIGAAVVAVVALIIGWRIYVNVSAKNTSAEWVRIDDATSLNDLEHIVEQDPNGKPTRIARFQMARIHLHKGMERFCSSAPGAREEALENLEKAAKLYDELASASKSTPILAQEALMGIAKAKEALDELDAARDAYEKLASQYPDSVNGKKAAERLKKLNDDKEKAQVDALYKKLGELAGPTPK